MDPIGALQRGIWEGYFDLHGRSTRADYWWFYLLSSLGSLLLGLSAGASFGTPLAAPMELLLVSYTVLIVPPQIAIGVRRMRDAGRSGWWVLAPITIIGILPYLYFCLKPSEEDR